MGLFVPSYGLQGTYPDSVRIYGFVYSREEVFRMLEEGVDIVLIMAVVGVIGFHYRSYVFILGYFRLVGTKISY